MNLAFDNARVTGHLGTVPDLQLPDPDDRHVVSAAVLGGASAIVTANIKDSPTDVLADYDLAVMTPDEFLIDLLESEPDTMNTVIDQQAADTRNPPLDVADILIALGKAGVPKFVTRLRGE
jgi:hypothetical protein